MVVINAYIIVRILCRLRHKGTSRRLMRAIRNRYILYFILIIPFYGTSWIVLYADSIDQDTMPFLKDWLRVLKLTLLISGFLKASIRLFEPFVYENLIDYLRKCWACLTICTRSRKKERNMTAITINESVSRNELNLRRSQQDKIKNSKKKKEINQNRENDLNTFLNKAINIEYVFLILTGIVRIM